MLTERQIPLEISSLKGSHCRVLIGLFRYADKQGVCWPSLRTLAATIPMAVRSVRRAIDDMAALGYLSVTKIRGSVNQYRIAAKFLRAMGYTARPQPVEQAPIQDEADDRQLAFIFDEGVRKEDVAVRPVRTEGKAIESQESIKKEEAIPFGRDAPLLQPPSPSVIKIAEIPGLKAKKKELRRQKVMRFVAATYSGEEGERRWNGMMGLDDVRDDQWWFDKCDAEMKLAKWDDVRDKHQSWQRIA